MTDRTEAPTAKRLAEARKKGQIPVSRELNAAVGLLLASVLLGSAGREIARALAENVSRTMMALPGAVAEWSFINALIVDNLFRIAPQLGILVLAFLLIGSAITLGQTKFLFASEKLGFNFERLDPIKGVKNLFSLNSLFELGKTLVKLLVIGFIVYGFLKSNIEIFMSLVHMDMSSAVDFSADLALDLFKKVGWAYLMLALADFIYQRWQHIRSLRMSKQEIKDERKQAEGDPLLKGKIRGKQQAFARMRMFANVPEADVVIVNPTHLAIALGYDSENMTAPIVHARGAYRIAERIVAVARENNIPVIQNIPLARALYPIVKVDQQIPPDFYVAIAEILAHVYRLKTKNPLQKVSQTDSTLNQQLV